MEFGVYRVVNGRPVVGMVCGGDVGALTIEESDVERGQEDNIGEVGRIVNVGVHWVVFLCLGEGGEKDKQEDVNSPGHGFDDKSNWVDTKIYFHINRWKVQNMIK